jgi:hypothetical protein
MSIELLFKQEPNPIFLTSFFRNPKKIETGQTAHQYKLVTPDIEER